MKLSFTTLGCPTWDLQTICTKAKQYGYDGIDFRGVQDVLDVTATPAFTRNVGATKRMIGDAGLEVSGFSTSITICDPTKRKANVDEAKRTIAAALELSCPNVRVFGGGDLKTMSRDEAAKAGRECIREILRLDGAAFLNWLVETHDNWIAGKDLSFLLGDIDHPSLGVLWDIGHTPRVGGESVEETYALIGKRVRYTHVKDAIKEPGHPLAMNDGWRYVAPGEGQLPLAQAVKLLKAGGYEGYLTLEHEKRWIPNLPEPDEILPKYVAWGRKVMA